MRNDVMGLAACVCMAAGAAAQVDNPDMRIRAEFRVPDASAWAPHESVGHAEFRVKSRFGQVYYGGVIRQDEFRFTVQVDFTSVSDYLTEFPGSIYNTNYDVYINDGFVGRLQMNNIELGLGELQYDSRHPSPPALPLPPNFPSPVNVFDTVSLFFASGSVPQIGDPMPSGDPIFSDELIEEFARGDANTDGDVDLLDFNILASNYDPSNARGPHIGPMSGDFTGDNRADRADYDTLVANWTDSADVPGEPIACPADISGSSDPSSPAYGTPDGMADSADFFYFLDQFVAGNAAVADLTGSSDPNDSHYGEPDENIDAEDFFYFLDLFVSPCA